MGWFDFVRSPAGTSVETLRIPLFPLNTVLFPGGLQPLKIFEQRYLDMAAACMKDNSPFGICLIDKGGEVGRAAVPHGVGTLATITNWEMEQLGILMITAQGGRRFRIIETQVGDGHLLEGTVELLAEAGPTPLPQERERLLPCSSASSATSGRNASRSRIATTTPSGWATGLPKCCPSRTWPSRSCSNSTTRSPAWRFSKST